MKLFEILNERQAHEYKVGDTIDVAPYKNFVITKVSKGWYTGFFPSNVGPTKGTQEEATTRIRWSWLSNWKKDLNENVEDEQSEANEKAVTLLMMAQTFMNKDEFNQYKKAWEQGNKNFSDGYEEDNDNLMYGGLDDIEGVGEELEDPVKDYFEDDFEAKYNQYAERTHEFQSGKSVDFDVSADETMKQARQALADYRKKKAAEKS